jgi:hypothetical protein
VLETPGIVSLLSPKCTTARRRTSPTGALGGATREGDGIAGAQAVRPTMAKMGRTNNFVMMTTSPLRLPIRLRLTLRGML